jgi:uncharacterized protein with GYD domain
MKGVTMPTFVMVFSYSSGSWARMLRIAYDRRAALAALIEHLHGKLEHVYWGVENAQALAIVELPDAVSATAAIAAATETAAFKDVQVHEVLTQDQLRQVLDLAKSAKGVYRPPGAAAIEDDLASY